MTPPHSQLSPDIPQNAMLSKHQDATDRGNHGGLVTSHIARHVRQSIVLALRPAIFDRHVPALEIAGFAQALAKGTQTARERSGDSLPRNPISGNADRCAREVSGHIAAAPPTKAMNSRRFMSTPSLRANYR